jgi:hypothetical protein
MGAIARAALTLLAATLVVLVAAILSPAVAAPTHEAPMLDGGAIVFHDTAGPCVAGALYAQYITPAGVNDAGLLGGSRIALGGGVLRRRRWRRSKGRAAAGPTVLTDIAP